MFVVSSSLDETVKSQISLYDITLFRSLTEFEKFVNTTPVVIDTLVFTTNEVAFTASNMQRVQAILSSPFIKLTGSVLYLVSENYNIKVINEYLTDKDLNNWVVYQGDLTVKYVMNMISGEGRDSTEAQLEVVTYRQRASEYVREHNLSESFSDDIHYTTDDEELAELPKEEEPELLNPTALNQTEVDYMVGDSFECTLFSFLVAQYRALTGKTVIVERDWEYQIWLPSLGFLTIWFLLRIWSVMLRRLKTLLRYRKRN